MAHPKEKRVILKNIDQPGYDTTLVCYEKHGGYQMLRKALAMEPSAVGDEVKKSGLRGRGGAGFPAGVKWGFIPPNNQKPVYLICNADESEPGTFKDRQIIHKDPHQLIEGIIITAYAIRCEKAFIYIRGEFPQGAQILERAIEEATARDYVGKNVLGKNFDLDIVVHRGAGAYICGEETGLIESLEGKRPYPRIKPPYFPAALGLYMCPTIVNNVETLCNLLPIMELGGEGYARTGSERNTGTRIYCVSGHVNKPGYYEFELGSITHDELIFDVCGGIRDGNELKAVIPGGSSAKILTAEEIKGLPMDFDSVVAKGSMSGSGGIIVLDHTTDIPKALANIAEFYAHESCGQCTPCREGVLWMQKILHRIAEGHGCSRDLDIVLNIAGNIDGGKTICAFGDAAAWPVQSYIAKFREEFEAKLSGGQPRDVDTTEKKAVSV